LIYRKMLAALESEGVAPIQAIGQRFDPALHEAVMQGPGAENTVVAEFQRGYTLHGVVIRPAMVKVGNGEAEPADAPTGG
jgi:molecular chaperone GrpE